MFDLVPPVGFELYAQGPEAVPFFLSYGGSDSSKVTSPDGHLGGVAGGHGRAAVCPVRLARRSCGSTRWRKIPDLHPRSGWSVVGQCREDVTLAPWRRTGTVLVVDDDEVIRQLIAVNLTLEGFDVATAVDGQDCLDKVTAIDPDVITLDS